MPTDTAAVVEEVPGVAATAPAFVPPARGRRRPLVHLADRIFGRVLMITQTKCEIILAALASDLGLSTEGLPIVIQPEVRGDGDKPYSVQNGIACIKVHGTLVGRANGMDALSGMTSYEDLSNEILDAVTDPNVKGIILDVDSPGGESSGMFDLADFIYEMRGQKPMIAVCADQMCSAAYGIASSADQIYTSRTGMVGSVGCYMLHVDQSGFDKERGVKFTYIFAGDHKVDGNPHEPLAKDAYSMMKAEVDRIRDMFVTQVARNRNVTAQQVIDTQAGVFFGQNAVPLLADKMGTLAIAKADLAARLGIDPNGEEEDPDDEDEDKINEYYMGLTEKYVNPVVRKSIPPGSEGLLVLPPATGIEVLNGRHGGGQIPSEEREKLYGYFAGKAQETGSASAALLSEPEYSAVLAVVNIDKAGTLEFEQFGVSAEERQISCAGNTDLDKAADFYGKLATEMLKGLRELKKDYPDAIACVRQYPDRGPSASAPASNRQIDMLVVPYEQASGNLGGFREIYQRGCFAEGLDNNPRATFNHDEGCILGRESAGTCHHWDDVAGVHCTAEAPETTWANDLLVSMRRGDINQASAAFWILQQRWEMRSGEKFRIVEKALLRESAVHAFPAYESSRATTQPAPTAVKEDVYQPLIELDQARLKLLRLR